MTREKKETLAKLSKKVAELEEAHYDLNDRFLLWTTVLFGLFLIWTIVDRN